MTAHLICIYRGLPASRHGIELGIQNEAACNMTETLSVFRSYFVFPAMHKHHASLCHVFKLRSMIKY